MDWILGAADAGGRGGRVIAWCESSGKRAGSYRLSWTLRGQKLRHLALPRRQDVAQ